MFGLLSEPLSITRQVLTDGLIAKAILAILVAIIAEFIKGSSQIGLRAHLFEDWWDGLRNEAKKAKEGWSPQAFNLMWSKLDKPTYEPSSLPVPVVTKDFVGEFRKSALEACALPNELFMRKIENMGRSALERASESAELFYVLTTGTSVDDQAMVIEMDRIARHPAILKNKDGEVAKEISPVILAAQDRTASAFERNLDDLQLRFAKEGPLWMYSLSILIGLILSAVVALSVNGFTGLLNVNYIIAMLAIGVMAGLLCGVGRDAFAKYFEARRQAG